MDRLDRWARRRDIFQTTIGLMVLSVPMLIVTCGYLFWRLWHAACGKTLG